MEFRKHRPTVARWREVRLFLAEKVYLFRLKRSETGFWWMKVDLLAVDFFLFSFLKFPVECSAGVGRF